MQEGIFSTLYVSETATLIVSGEIDDLALDELRAAIDTASDLASRDLVIDVSEVDYLPSMAISVLVGCLRRAEGAGSSLVLQAASGTISERVLHMTGMPHRQPAAQGELSDN